MDSDYQRVKDLFLSALGRESPAERAAFLTYACGVDLDLRGRVEALLRRHERAGQFLEEAATASAPPAPASEALGTAIGPYKLVEKLGEGGFGEVFLAEQQQPVRRKVALKILKPGLDTREVVARFEAERQALALMDHPHIARVIDGGESSSGRPYFVMELVSGLPITRYCDDRQLTPRERLALFVPVCQAVQHAHQKGIIHRDLKPTNILISTDDDGRPVPKVIDFGVAKAMGQQLTERTLSTGVGGIIGTLEYMSPEQAEFHARDIDTRADIYSLGVLLYELLTGTTPLTKQRVNEAALTEVLRLVREEEAPKPSSRLTDSKSTLASISAQRKLEPGRLTKEIRGELDWIVMKALEKDRNRRFETANALARDIERYLHDEPVESSPPSAVYRIRKFARKNRALIGTILAFMVILTAGAGISIWQAVRARNAENGALAALDREAEQRRLADRSNAESKSMFDFVHDKILSAARPKGRDGGLGPDVTLRAAVESAVPYVDKSFADQPLVEARVRRILGMSYMYFGDGKAAEGQFLPARAIFLQHLGPDKQETIQCSGDLARSYHMQGSYSEAARLNEELVAHFNAKFGATYLGTLQVTNNLAMDYFELKKYDDAIRLHKETLEIQEATIGPKHLSTLKTMNNLANCYFRAGRKPEALALREKALPLHEATSGPDDYFTLMCRHNLAGAYRDAKRYDDALKLDEVTLVRRSRTLGADHPDTVISMWSKCDDLIELDRGAVAIPLLDECLRLSAGRRIHSNFHKVAGLRLHYFEKLKNVAGCRQTAEIWEKLNRRDPDSVMQAGRCRAVTAAVIRITDSSPDGTKAADADADKAMAWLQKAVADGFKEKSKIKDDEDLRDLRGRPDFQKLVSTFSSDG